MMENSLGGIRSIASTKEESKKALEEIKNYLGKDGDINANLSRTLEDLINELNIRGISTF